MWNEHCSYKSSKVHLRNLPTKAPWVIQGPGENAGVIDIGDGLAVVFKMESHNHPSYIEPYQGAATGVGGILRDVFTMGARPIACLNALSFGAPSHPQTRHLVARVVAGIAIMAKDCVIAIQDMGAAGLTCSAVEMGAKGGLGVTLVLDAVPCREAGMSAYEMMLSESQERMLMVLRPEKEREAEAIFRKSGLEFAVVGTTTPTKRFIVRHRGKVMADLPIKELGDEAPLYDRPHVDAPKHAVVTSADVTPPIATADALLRLIGSPDLRSRRWGWEQYDRVILGQTVQRPAGDAADVRINDGPKALALTPHVP